MPKLIIWSPLSEKDFENILDYLYNRWGENIANNFIDITNDLVEQISIRSFLCERGQIRASKNQDF
jgi:plasmid stabilization system protein ParE